MYCKMKLKFKIYKALLFLVTALLWSYTSSAQEEEISIDQYRMYFKFSTVKQDDNSRQLQVNFMARNKKDRKDRVPIYDANIEFFNVLEDEEISLGSAKTNKEGDATVTVAKDHQYLIDTEGNINLAARFEGTDALDAEDDEIAVKDIWLDLDLAEIDSVKTITVSAHALDSVGNKIPVDEVDIALFVQGMLSKMKLDEGTISDGEYVYEIEDELPGDADQNITFFAMITDNDDYGNVTKKQSKLWGVFEKNNESESGNKLWTEAAPIWMYIVLTILLVGIWVNFAYTIIHLIKIKKEGKNLETNT